MTDKDCKECAAKVLIKSITTTPNSPLKRLLHIIHIKRECFINDLWEFVAFKTISSREDKRDELHQACDWLIKRLAALDIVVFPEKMGMEIMEESFQTIKMPNTIIGIMVQSPDNPTVLVYGYMDVENAEYSEGWRWDPFFVNEHAEHLYGRGTVYGKGPLLCWLNAIQCHRDANMRLPVNLVFVIEGMGRNNSLGLEQLLRNRISFFREVSCVCIADKRWMTKSQPCIIHGSRGLIYYHLEVECAKKNLNSCEHGGTIYEALPDLFYLLSSLVNPSNTIPIEGVEHPYELDGNLLNCTTFDLDELSHNLKAFPMPNKGKKADALACNWGMPHISIHGIEGAHATDDIRCVIPHKVIGKFSVALSPSQEPAVITQAIIRHLGDVWLERGSPNRMALCEKYTIPAWTGKCDTREYRAAVRAAREVYNKTPDIIRDGGAMLAPSIFQNVLGKNVLVIPIADYDNGGQPVNERLRVDNYMKGSQMIATFMHEYAKKQEGNMDYWKCVPKC